MAFAVSAQIDRDIWRNDGVVFGLPLVVSGIVLEIYRRVRLEGATLPTLAIIASILSETASPARQITVLFILLVSPMAPASNHCSNALRTERD